VAGTSKQVCSRCFDGCSDDRGAFSLLKKLCARISTTPPPLHSRVALVPWQPVHSLLFSRALQAAAGAWPASTNQSIQGSEACSSRQRWLRKPPPYRVVPPVWHAVACGRAADARRASRSHFCAATSY